MHRVAEPLIVVAGPTASGKSALALAIALQFGGEVVSCDSVAVYRGLDIGSAKPTAAQRKQVPHHTLDLLAPDQPSTAGDYARAARAALAGITGRGRLPVVAGGTGLYLRALLDGLAPAPRRDNALRERLQRRAARNPASLHRILRRLDPVSAAKIHAHDLPKLIRSLEVRLLGSEPQSLQWEAGRQALEGYRVLQLGLRPPRSALYERIDARAAAMFRDGLLQETATALQRFGEDAPGLRALGYAQAAAVLQGRQGLQEAVAESQQGHRNYAKRQLTWFRRDTRVEWIEGFGDEPWVQDTALARVGRHLMKRDAGTAE